MSSLLAKVRRSLLRHASECFALSTFDHCLFRPAASHSRDGDDDRLAEPLTLESFPATVEGVAGEKERSRCDRAGGPGKVFEKGCAAEASLPFASQIKKCRHWRRSLSSLGSLTTLNMRRSYSHLRLVCVGDVQIQ